MTHAGFPNGIGKIVEDIADNIKNNTDHTYRHLIIEVDQHSIGEMNYYKKGKHTVGIGIKICDFSTQNRGFGKIFLIMLISFLFSEMGYIKIVLDTNTDNIRAQHIYEQLGFKKLRVNTNSWRNQLGKLQSSIDYEMYQKDFVNYAI